MLTNLKTGKRLFLAFGLILALMAGSAAAVALGLRAVGAGVESVKDQTTKIVLAGQVREQLKNVVMNVGVICATDDPKVQQAFQARIDAIRPAYAAGFEKLRATAHTEKSKVLIGEVEAITAELRAVDNTVVQLARSGKGAEARRLFTDKAQQALARLEAKYDELSAWRFSQAQTSVTQVEKLLALSVTAVLLATLAALVLAGIMGTLITRGITAPLGVAAAHLDELARGDVRRDLPQDQLSRGDEFGDMARAMQRSVERLRSAFVEVAQGGQLIASASTELSALSGQMADGTRHTSQRAGTVAAAAEEMSVNAASVAAGMEQATASLAGIAEATAQMTATITEIAGNSEKARAITGEANRQAEGMGALMQELGRGAQAIGKVTETINSISAQTNLLALNATIEAARAGSAGKGFAVVAGEIKELAHQTASATEDIKGRIGAIQKATAGAVEDIARIGGVIREVSDIVSTIATAIEEQSMMTREIAGNLGQASSGVRDANHRVTEGSTVSRSIARDIAGVDGSAQEVAGGVEQVKASAVDLSRLAERLNRTVQEFRT